MFLFSVPLPDSCPSVYSGALAIHQKPTAFRGQRDEALAATPVLAEMIANVELLKSLFSVFSSLFSSFELSRQKQKKAATKEKSS